MAAPVGSLVVRVGSDISGLTSGLQKGARQVENLGRTANKVAHRDFRKLQQELAASRREVSGTTAAFSKFARVAGPLIGAAFGFKAVSSIVRTADAYTQLQNRLRAVTDSGEELERVQARLFDISRDTRSAMGSNVELFSRLSLATRDLGTSQDEILEFTRSLNQAIKLSGASAAEAEAGILQLSQGMASGTLRGDELRSVLEQLPAVADVIARSLGVTRGQLRQMGTDGKITADVILKAFREARGELADQFGETVPTIAESFVLLQNSLLKLGGAFSQATGLGDSLAEAISNIAGSIDDLAGSASVRFLKDLPDILKAGNEALSGFDDLSSLSRGKGALPRLVPPPPAATLPSVIIPEESIQNAVRLRLLMEGVAELGDRATTSFGAMSDVAAMAADSLSPLGQAISSVFQIPPAEELQAEAERRLEVIRQAGLSEQDLAQEQFEQKLATLEEQFQTLLITDEQFKAQREALEQEHQDRVTAIMERAADAQKRIEEEKKRAQISTAFGAAHALASIVENAAQENFALQKAAAIAGTIINAVEAAANAYTFGSQFGPGVATAMAAVAFASQSARLAAIRSSDFKSGGGGADAGAGSGSAPSPAPQPGGGGGGGVAGPAQTVNISLQGDTFGQRQVRELIGRINDVVADGATLRLT